MATETHTRVEVDGEGGWVADRDYVDADAPQLPDYDLIADVKRFLRRFVDLPSEAHEEVLAVWIIHTWMINAAFVTPYVYVSSKGPSTGKTRTMDVLSTLVRNPDSGTDSPPHVLAQEIAASSPTLFFDEMDTVYAGGANNGLKRILNIGYKKGAVVKRQRASQIEVWEVFCPKVLAGIRNNHLPVSLLSRCIPIEMVGRKRELERFNQFHIARDPERISLVDRLAAFAEDFLVEVAVQRPQLVKSLGDRENEICEPLIAIASVLGRELELRESLVKIFRTNVGKPSMESTILGRIRKAFDLQKAMGGPGDRIFTEELLKIMGPTFNGRQLGILLSEMGFARTGSETLRIDNQTKNGYWREDFEPLFAKHLDLDLDAGPDDDDEEVMIEDE